VAIDVVLKPHLSQSEQWLKYTILAEVSFLAFLATLNVAIVNPAVVPLSQEFNVSHVTGTYQTTIAIGTSSLGPLLFTPFANIYGRRSAYLISILIGFASAAGSAAAKSFGTLILARAINGFGPSAALGLGAGTVVDLFYVHERGRAMGFFTLILTQGAHLAPIVSDFFSPRVFVHCCVNAAQGRRICRQGWRLEVVFLDWCHHEWRVFICSLNEL